MGTMNKMLEYVTREQGESMLCFLDSERNPDELDQELKQEVMDSLEEETGIKIWDDLSMEDKIDCIKYVVHNIDDEDFGHSQCCQLIHQATALFLVEEWCKRFNKDDFISIIFDDLDCLANN
jgi:hypothetical protein